MDWLTNSLDKLYTTTSVETVASVQAKNDSFYSNINLNGDELYSCSDKPMLDADASSALDQITSTHDLGWQGQGGARPTKECGVCGDKALGHNFNAITCESCKAFFRRNALKCKEFRCPFNNTCTIDMVTRRFCQKCRLKKCYSIGMKKEWIMTDDEKRLKRRRASDNRMRKLGEFHTPLDIASAACISLSPVMTAVPAVTTVSDTVSFSGDANVGECDVSLAAGAGIGAGSAAPVSGGATVNWWPPGSPQSPYQPSNPLCSAASGSTQLPYQPNTDSLSGDQGSVASGSPQSPLTPVSNSILPLPEQHRTLQLQLTSIQNDRSAVGAIPDLGTVSAIPLTYRDASIQTDSADHNGLDDGSFTLTNILRSAVRAEFAPSVTPAATSGGQLTHAERAKIHELLDAQQTLMTPLSDDNCYVNLVSREPSLVNVINLCDVAIRRLIQMSKKMACFRALCQRDQIALLKGGCTELMILRSVTTFDAENNCWNIQASKTDMTSIKLNVLNNAPHDVCDQHRRFNLTFRHQWKTDPYIMGLLSAITLLDPERANVEHGNAIALEQEAYFFLLRRYLLASMSLCEANTEFVSLVRKLDELKRLNAQHVKIFTNVDPHHVEPLLIEIFDLKTAHRGSLKGSISQGSAEADDPLAFLR